MNGDWVVVSGATGGIGAALLAQLAAAGYRPAIGYRSGRAAAEELARRHGGAAVALDLLDFAQIDAAVERFAGQPVAALVLNASPPPDLADFGRVSAEAFEAQFRPSVIGHHRLLAGIIDNAFKPRRAGTVVAVLSSAMGDGKRPAMKQMTPYVVAKFALQGLIQAAKAEYRWLAVATVSPGFTDTAMLAAFDERFIELLRGQNGITAPEAVAAEILGHIRR